MVVVNRVIKELITSMNKSFPSNIEPDDITIFTHDLFDGFTNSYQIISILHDPRNFMKL
jgi:hypothetical protein